VTDRWIVLQEEQRRRFGGDLRRARILRPLAERTGAVVAGWSPGAAGPVVARHGAGGLPWARRQPPRLASAEFLDLDLLGDVVKRTRPTVLDVHDDPLAQLRALGVAADEDRDRRLAERVTRNRDAFEILLAPTASFADLAGLPADRTVVAPNGTDTTVIRPEPFPDRPAVGFATGAAPGRGIEHLVEAVRIVRDRRAEVRLLLWLVGTGADSEAYLAGLQRQLAAESWIELRSATYDAMSGELARASVLAIPHPPGAYLDVALPIKLVDAMAAGRPVVVTPRIETARIVRDAGCGLVVEDDLAALADGLATLLDDPERGARLGANGRQLAERRFDWTVIGETVADAVLARVSGDGMTG
jgi:glycosyltransferase involved in cell wall biosynthesis